jgi:hypothetical protein
MSFEQSRRTVTQGLDDESKKKSDQARLIAILFARSSRLEARSR